MQLSDCQIHEAIRTGELAFGCPLVDYPFRPEVQVQPASVDLRLGNRVVRYPKDLTEFNVRDLKTVGDILEVQYIPAGAEIRIGPQEIVFAQVYEQIAIGDRFSGRIEGRSRMARLGLSVHCTGDYINPGFSGAMPLQLVNHNSFTVVLYPFMTVCQLIIYQLTSRPLVSYAERSVLPFNQYYGETNPSPSILHKDAEISGEDHSGSVVLARSRALIQNYLETMNLDRTRIREGDLESRAVIVNVTNNLKEYQMRDQYVANQVGIQGPDSGTHAEVKQIQLSSNSGDLEQLLKELKELRNHMKRLDADGEHDVEVGKVAEAERELAKGNQSGFLSALRSGGKWVLQKAGDAGCSLLVKYIEGQIFG